MNNSSDNIVQQVYESFGVLPPEQRAASKPASETPAEPEPIEFVDLYKGDFSSRRAESRKRRPRGSSPIVLATTKAVIDGDGVPANGLAQAYERAKEASVALKAKGEPSRADMEVRQYMEERFLPAVETVIRYSSPDELLNCKEALKALDKHALGVGSMSGYTAAYVRSAYGDLLGKDLDGRFDKSDPAITDMVMRVRVLADKGDIRNAIGVAKQAKKQVDDGENMASEDDYELISRVVAYAN